MSGSDYVAPRFDSWTRALPKPPPCLSSPPCRRVLTRHTCPRAARWGAPRCSRTPLDPRTLPTTSSSSSSFVLCPWLRRERSAREGEHVVARKEGRRGRRVSCAHGTRASPRLYRLWLISQGGSVVPRFALRPSRGALVLDAVGGSRAGQKGLRRGGALCVSVTLPCRSMVLHYARPPWG